MSDIIIPQGVVPIASEVIRAFDMQNIRILAPPPNQFNGAISQLTTQDTAFYKSNLGTPVLADITFYGGAYTDNLGNILNFPKMTFYTVLLSVSQSKNIIETIIQGRDGTVKEYIGMGDYRVDVNLLITAPNGSYPRQEVQQLKQMLVAPMSLQVTSWYLQLFGISYLVVNSFTCDQVEGGYSIQPVRICCSSDLPLQFSVR